MTDQTPAAKPARKPRAKPDNRMKSLTPAQSEGATAPYKTQPQLAGRPYTLESSTVANDIARYGAAARSEIEAIEADCLAIQQRANQDVEAINARRDIEIAARRERIMDLDRIVAMSEAATLLPEQPRQAPRITSRPDTE